MISQSDLILDHIQRFGSITPAEAFTQYGSLALHSRAAELREKGYNVVCTIKRNGRSKWGEYRLVGQLEMTV